MRADPARVAIAAGFATQGFVLISLTTRLPALTDRWRLSELELSGLLLMMVLLAGAGSGLAERLARRSESAAQLRAGLGLMALAVPALAAAPVPAVFVLGLATYGVSLGVVDAATNMQAVSLEHRRGRPLLPSFHGAWTVGAALGAATTLATPGLPLTALAGVAVLPLGVGFAPFLRRERGTTPAATGVAVPWPPIALVGGAVVLFYLVDTAAATWGPIYLDRTLAAPRSLVALATFPYLVASGLVRLAGDRLVARHGPARVLRAGAVLAAAALAVVVLAPTWPVAVLGFTALGAGTAVIAPLSFSAAARIAGDGEPDPVLRQVRVDAVIGRFNQFNYVGALLGAVLVGVVGAGSLRLGFAVPMVLVLGVLPLARHFAPRG